LTEKIQINTINMKKFRRKFSAETAIAFIVVILVQTSTKVLTSSVNDCRGVKYAYSAKGLDQSDVPRQPRQGSQLQICPSGLTCCTQEMEQKLWSVSKDHYGKSIQVATGSMQKLFNKKGKKFDEYFTELLIQSKLKFHQLFQKTYGIIYERNSDVFIDFFKDLEHYYDHGEVDLEDALKSFFSHLYQRMFTVFNAQHNFDSTYLSCVSQTMKKLQPFGDVPKKLTEQLRRSFVASRTFAQALLEGKQIVNKISKIQPKEECVRALTKMSNCPACQGLPEVRPCSGYCINVMKGCLAFHAELNESWGKFIDNLGLLADRLIGPFDIEAVVDPIGVKISDAIMNFQNSGYEVTSKVFEDCGRPRLQKRQGNAYGYAYGNSGRRSQGGYHRGREEAQVEDTRLKNLIRDTKNAMNNTRQFWTQLPYELCRNSDSRSRNGNGGHSRSRYGRQEYSESHCWNGKDTGRYTSNIVADGLAYQDRNPEVRVDINRPDVDINEQIFALKLITKKLESAHKGQNVDWPSTSSFHEPVNHEPVKEGSGGGCSYNDDEDCYSDDDTYYENYYYEGSGSGDGSDEDSSKTNEGSKDKPDPKKNNKNKNRENEADDDEENWPPWVTAKPVEENKINDIEMVDEANNPVIKPKPRKPSFNRSSPNLSGSVLSVTCATLLALYFAVKSH